jgi:hypothetical protein
VEFDPKAEEVTLRILRKLSRFRDIDDLQPKTIGNILENQALRNRLSRASTDAAEDELIEEALVAEMGTLEKRLAEHETRLTEVESKALDREADLRTRLEAQQRELEQRTAEARRLHSDVEAHRSGLDLERGRTTKAQREVHDLSARISSLEQMLEEGRVVDKARQDRRRFGILAIAVGAAAAFAAILFAGWIDGKIEWPDWLTYGGVGVGFGASYLLGVEQIGTRSARLAEWSVLMTLTRIRRVLVAAVIGVVLSVVASFIYEAIK